MFSWRYSQAFPLDTVNRAADFMAKLRLIYPHADTLCEKDFEWLFDCPETKQFLEWFCSTVGEENVLSPAEVEAYEALLAAGKPILEGDALEEALQMCCQVLQLPGSIVAEGPSQEALQQELQELKHHRDRQLWRYRKLLAWTNKLQQEQKYLEEEEKLVKQKLRVAHMDLKAKIFKTRAFLSQVSEAAKQVSECPENTGMDQLLTLLCQMDLAPYLEQEQQATDAFESFIQQVLPECVQASDVWEESAQGESSLKEGLEAETQMDSYCEIPEERRGAPYQECTKTLCGGASASWGKLWAQRTLDALEDNQQAVQAELQSQLRALRSDIAHTLAQRLPALLRAEARRLRLPILHRHLSLRVARLQDTARRQEEAAAWLLSQHSRLELLELQLKRERKELEHKAAWLEKIETIMRESQTRLPKQQIDFRGAKPSQKGHPHKWIDPKDLTAVRLWDMLMGKDQKKQQPFRSYAALAAKCSQLVQDKRALEAQLEAPLPQVSALESSMEVLYHQLYSSSNQLQLSSPVRQHCPSPGPCWVAGPALGPSAILPGCRADTWLPLSHRGRGAWPEPCLVPKTLQ
uniref:HAUS augmin-like complex subunit 3 N-terminal domain-containing protein n=1 Tax=Geospiza parvula TaxID=87175 RepID=A0A8C3Q3U8_GEOPR